MYSFPLTAVHKFISAQSLLAALCSMTTKMAREAKVLTLQHDDASVYTYAQPLLSCVGLQHDPQNGAHASGHPWAVWV